MLRNIDNIIQRKPSNVNLHETIAFNSRHQNYLKDATSTNKMLALRQVKIKNFVSVNLNLPSFNCSSLRI